MKTTYLILLTLFWALVINSSAGAQEPLYTSEDGVELYDAPNADANIVSTLAKGTALRVLETADSGYTRVHTPDNWEGWVSSQLLVAAPPSAASSPAPPAPTHDPSMPSTDTTPPASEVKIPGPALGIIKPLAAKKPADSVQAQLAAARQELKAARELNRRLKGERSLKWFMAGAAVLLLGFLIGLIVPKVQWRRKSWHTY